MGGLVLNPAMCLHACCWRCVVLMLAYGNTRGRYTTTRSQQYGPRARRYKWPRAILLCGIKRWATAFLVQTGPVRCMHEFDSVACVCYYDVRY